jgi:hypothetical protein
MTAQASEAAAPVNTERTLARTARMKSGRNIADDQSAESSRN